MQILTFAPHFNEHVEPNAPTRSPELQLVRKSRQHTSTSTVGPYVIVYGNIFPCHISLKKKHFSLLPTANLHVSFLFQGRGWRNKTTSSSEV